MTRAVAVIVAGVVPLGLIPAPHASAREVIDLRRARSFAVTDVGSIGPAGDVNGDGESDAVIAKCSANDHAGRVRVLWGPFQSTRVRGTAAGDGFTIIGAESKDYACRLSMTRVGDVNGDGLDDVLVGADLADQSGRSGSGAVYVVFGKRDDEPVRLAEFDSNMQAGAGYRVDGPGPMALAGGRLAGVGDMNADGRTDFIVGAPFNGASYVVFGQATPTPVDLMTFDLGAQGNAGFRISTYVPDASDGYSVGSAGDVNGDGIPDVIVGVVPDAHDSPGAAFVVFGKADPVAVDTTTSSPQSFRISGERDGDGTGYAVGAAGDVNGDGLADVVVGAPRTYSCCRGKAVVVFGKEDAEDVAVGELRGAGFKIAASQNHDFFGFAVGGLGDVDDDGFADVAVGVPGFDYPGRGGPGAVFVIFGKESTGTVRVGRLGRRGFLVAGRRDADWTGTRVSGPGDMNGDGVPDVMISATTGGKAYLLWLRRPV